MKQLSTLGLLASLLAGTTASQEPPKAEFEAGTGPVTVVSVQPPLPNAADYRASHAELDTNGDGVITRGELPTTHALYFEFKLVDRNRDGRITATELANWK
ncbi:MAG: EF-hand domain-containing protein [Rhizobium sp.]|nr:EF-hand domain-containing protein [Rhizobium sp.]